MYVWAEGRNGLEKRVVTVGEYNMAMDTYEVLDGLTEMKKEWEAWQS